MKKAFRILMSLALIVSLVGICGTTTSCKSSKESMYSAKKKNSKTINQNYRVRGNNQRNSSTYHTY